MVQIEGDWIEVWSSRDALLLKAVAIVLSRQWNSILSNRCFHLSGRGGSTAAVRQVMQTIHNHQNLAVSNAREEHLARLK